MGKKSAEWVQTLDDQSPTKSNRNDGVFLKIIKNQKTKIKSSKYVIFLASLVGYFQWKNKNEWNGWSQWKTLTVRDIEQSGHVK